MTENVKIPYYCINEAPELAEDFIRIKQEYSNGIIYDTRVHRIYSRLRSRGHKYSIQKITSLIENWLKLGWIAEENGCYFFKSNNGRKTTSVPRKDLKYNLRRLIITTNLKRQYFASQTKKNLKCPSGRGAYKKHKAAKKAIKKLAGDTSRFNTELMLSYQSASSLWGMTPNTAVRVIDRMVKEGYVLRSKAKFYRRSSENFLKRTPNAYSLQLH